MERKFKVGDKVRIKEDSGWGDVEGLSGVVELVADSTHYYPYNVTLDEVPEGHIRENWLMKEDELEEI